jgi:hypothetical protein
MTGVARDLLDRGSAVGLREDGGVGFFSTHMPFILKALGDGERLSSRSSGLVGPWLFVPDDCIEDDEQLARRTRPDTPLQSGQRLVTLIGWTVKTVVAPSQAALSTWKPLGTSAEGRRVDIITLISC